MASSVVPAPLLEALAADAPVDAKPKPSTKKQAQNPATPPEPKIGKGYFNLDAWIGRYAPDANGPSAFSGGGQIWVLPDCIFRPGDGPTMFIIQRDNGAISAGCQHDTCPGSKSTGNHWIELREHFEGATFRGPYPVDTDLDQRLSTLPRTEYGLAERFRRRFGDHVRFVETWGGKWLVFNGRYWQQSNCAAEIYAQETVSAIRREALHLKEDTDD